MASQRSPGCNKANKLFKEHNCYITNRKIAELLFTFEKLIRI
ncbi:hypothetical protein JDS78_19570 [Bacillus cereus group sp. N17]|nr:hypothetical protein [Bacillus cereus group sp. N17]PEE29892.1 hypothetical protein CON98_11965 [Bacillus toyonensis]PHA78106.1 hypothetical protein COE72_00940 [Bacillus toyonensis]